jgi:hypothetical protein
MAAAPKALGSRLYGVIYAGSAVVLRAVEPEVSSRERPETRCSGPTSPRSTWNRSSDPTAVNPLLINIVAKTP